MIENTRRAWARWRTRLHATVADERGDVPGWVMITLMTAGLVVIIWALAGQLLQEVFTEAIERILGGP